jgi:transposase-like protein
MVARRRAAARTTARERQAILAEFERSGLSLRQFARRRGMPVGTLGYWQHVARARAGAPAARRRDVPDFVELPAVEIIASSRAMADGFAVQLGDGRTVRMPARFDAEALGRLLRVLAAPC